jgi:hypothetical protein
VCISFATCAATFRAKQRVTGVAYDDYVMQQKGRHDRGLLFHTGGGAEVEGCTAVESS